MLKNTCTLLLLLLLSAQGAQAASTSLNATTRFVSVENKPSKFERIASKASHYNFRYVCKKSDHSTVKNCVKVYK